MEMTMSNTRIAAIFDVDGTLVAGDSLERIFFRFLWRRGELGRRDLFRCVAGGLSAAAARRSPLRANKYYLCGKDAAQIRRLARKCFEVEIAPRLLTPAIDRLRWHQSGGHFVILLSGTLDLLLEPLAEHLGVSARIGTALDVEGRLLTGRIAGLHPYGEAKAECLTAMNRVGLFNAKRSFAYADAYSDRHLLACVGNPVATNADSRLRLLAGKRGWMVEDFAPAGEKIFLERAYDRG
jgi:putative phosphoserine phosphatase/1-acylglycerol-3-phosphate O-acyltransferase